MWHEPSIKIIYCLPRNHTINRSLLRLRWDWMMANLLAQISLSNQIQTVRGFADQHSFLLKTQKHPKSRQFTVSDILPVSALCISVHDVYKVETPRSSSICFLFQSSILFSKRSFITSNDEQGRTSLGGNFIDFCFCMTINRSWHAHTCLCRMSLTPKVSTDEGERVRFFDFIAKEQKFYLSWIYITFVGGRRAFMLSVRI